MKKSPTPLFYLFIASVSLVVFSFCKGEKPDDNNEEETTGGISLIDNKQISAQNVFNSIPARAEIVRLIGESKIDYDPSYLNNPDVASKYSLENSRALNLGVYGADLSVAGAFDQTQESMLFLKCVNILSKNLGVSTAFDQHMMDRMEVYKENRDSTLEIIAQSFRKADEFLKQNERPGTSALILSGSWIEGMYVSVQIAQRINSENIIKTILKQDESLKHLINMVEASNVSPDAKYVTDGLNDLKVCFDNAAKNAAKNKTYTLDAIKEICDKTNALRKKVVETY
jgi:hypothetical protein